MALTIRLALLLAPGFALTLATAAAAQAPVERVLPDVIRNHATPPAPLTSIQRWQCRKTPTTACLIAEAAALVEGSALSWSGYISFAVQQSAAGDHDGAAKTFGKAARAAREVANPDGRAAALRDTAIAQAESGDLGSALQVADEIADADLRDEALAVINRTQVRAGRRSGATPANGAPGDAPSLADTTPGARARAQAHAGDIASAMQMASEIADPSERVFALHGIARAQASAGDRAGAAATFDEALQNAGEIGAALPRAAALSGIAIAQARAGFAASAIGTAAEISDALALTVALGGIATAQARAGDAPAALDTAALIEDKAARAEILLIISTTLDGAE